MKVITKKIENWTNIHSLGVTLLSIYCLISKNIYLLIFFAATSFLTLIFISKHNWAPSGAWGLANTVTTFRLTIIFMIAIFTNLNNYLVIILSLLILILDGLDGYLARKMKLQSDFGEVYDKEIDAFFILILCFLLIFEKEMTPFLLILGLLRYLFVCFLLIIRSKIKKERRSKIGRHIFVFLVLALITGFLPSTKFYLLAIILATILLIYSFTRDIRWIILQKLNQN